MTAPIPSAATTAVQMPSMSKSRGITSTMPPRSRKDRMKEMKAETAPLHSAVKKAEA